MASALSDLRSILGKTEYLYFVMTDFKRLNKNVTPLQTRTVIPNIINMTNTANVGVNRIWSWTKHSKFFQQKRSHKRSAL